MADFDEGSSPSHVGAWFWRPIRSPD
jgi:hypothetical protein